VAFLFYENFTTFYETTKALQKIFNQIGFLFLCNHFIVVKFLNSKKVKMQTVKEIAKGVAIVALGIIAAQQLQKALKLN